MKPIPPPTGEEVAPKLRRLLYFVGAGVVCTAAINKWKDIEKIWATEKEQQINGSSLENQTTGGCRPSLFFRLLYYVCGSELDTQLDEFLQGRRRGNLAELSAKQLDIINALHCKTIKEEDKFSSRIATLQEEIADEPLAMLAKMGGSRVGEWSEELERAMSTHSKLLTTVLADVDRLRLDSFKELVAILTPLQATDLLVASYQLHISMHEWGKKKKCQKPN